MPVQRLASRRANPLPVQGLESSMSARARKQGDGPASRATNRIQRALLAWFAKAQRPLPWREGYDPYRVWVSEMMLQQTQVETVKPYFARWMARFPSVQALAEAPLEDVLKRWEGLGYYARARNLHRAAREIVARHGGEIPDDLEMLLALPGIGPYSAGAIASIAFNRAVPLVDGNVARVLSRLFALREAPQSSAGKRHLWSVAESLLPASGGRDFNQALMELGALLCRSRQPLCGLCPVRADCLAYAKGNPEDYPARRKRAERPVVRACLAIAKRGDFVLMRQRPPEGLWGGLWEFPWIEHDATESNSRRTARGTARETTGLSALLAQLRLGKAGLGNAGQDARQIGTVHHGLTHRQYEWSCFVISVRGKGRSRFLEAGGALRWVPMAELDTLALGRPMHKVLELWRNGEG
jgi:A/G-specific adenine glycosylase